MPNVLARILLFLSSYFPLFIIFSILWMDRYFLVGAILIGAGALSLLGLLLYLRQLQAFAVAPVTVQEVRRRDSEAMSYIVTYIIPFLAFPLEDGRQALSLGLLFIMIGFLYVNSNMIHINPMLNVFGFHLYEVVLSDRSSRTLVGRRRRLKSGDTIKVVQVGDDLLFSNT